MAIPQPFTSYKGIDRTNDVSFCWGKVSGTAKGGGSDGDVLL